MRGVLLSINAVFNYDPDIFENLSLPGSADIPQGEESRYIDNPPDLDASLLVANILTELGEMNLVYSDPATLKMMISIWNAVNYDNWVNLYKTTILKYNPIWNKDGTVTETKSGSGRVDGGSTTEYGRTQQHDVTGYDTNSYSPDTKETAGGKDTVTTGSMYSNGETVTRTEQGNIGVTMTQTLITEERKVVEFNMYHYITESFKERFCVMTY